MHDIGASRVDGTTVKTGRAYVIHPFVKQFSQNTGASSRAPEAFLEEAVGLAEAIHLDVVYKEVVSLTRVRPSQLIGSGVAERVRDIVEQEELDLVIIDHSLTPIQQRNLERLMGVKVIDRTGLILEIFGDRARTKEGKLQVELAALTYQKSRLVRSWTHLERQRGGVGFMGGPGESQLEIDRRLISERLEKIKRELAEVRRTRGLHRQARQKIPYPVIALVGYTNAGKSTLFNRLSGADVFAKDLLFATLDPTMRAIDLPSGRKVILSDTVGFISELPTMLVEAFRATLEEVDAADVIIHVRDISHEDSEAQKQDVIDVLGDMGIDYVNDPRLIEVLNKVDVLSEAQMDHIQEKSLRDSRSCLVSAYSGYGIDRLCNQIDKIVTQSRKLIEVKIAFEESEVSAWFYSHAEVLKQEQSEECFILDVSIEPDDLSRFTKKFGDRVIEISALV